MTRNGLSTARVRRQGLAAATAGVLRDLTLFELLEPRRLYAADLPVSESVAELSMMVVVSDASTPAGSAGETASASPADAPPSAAAGHRVWIERLTVQFPTVSRISPASASDDETLPTADTGSSTSTDSAADTSSDDAPESGASSTTDTSSEPDARSTVGARWEAVLVLREARREAAAAALGVAGATVSTSPMDLSSTTTTTTTPADDYGSPAATERTRALFERIFARPATTAIKGEDGLPVTSVQTLPATTSGDSSSYASSADDSADDAATHCDDDSATASADSGGGKVFGGHHGKFVFDGDFDGDGTTDPVFVIIEKLPVNGDPVVIALPGEDESVFGQPLPGSGGTASEDGTRPSGTTTSPAPSTVGPAGVGEIVIGVIDVLPPQPSQGDASGSVLSHAGGGTTPVEFRGAGHHDGTAGAPRRGPSARPVERPPGDPANAQTSADGRAGDGSDRSDAIDALTGSGEERGSTRSTERSDASPAPRTLPTILVAPMGLAAAAASTLKVTSSAHVAATAAEVAAAVAAGGPLAGAQALIRAAREDAGAIAGAVGTNGGAAPDAASDDAVDAAFPTFNAVLLGLAPAWSMQSNAANGDESSGRFWEIAATGSLIVTLAGCWYCATAPKQSRRDRNRRSGAGRFATGRKIRFEAVND